MRRVRARLIRLTGCKLSQLQLRPGSSQWTDVSCEFATWAMEWREMIRMQRCSDRTIGAELRFLAAGASCL
eukprot:763884-Hanusia_phi.AAC.1